MNAPTIIRNCKCHCGNHFEWPVTFSETTPKLAGESRRECPKCGRDAFTATAWRIKVGSITYDLDIGNKIENPEEVY